MVQFAAPGFPLSSFLHPRFTLSGDFCAGVSCRSRKFHRNICPLFLGSSIHVKRQTDSGNTIRFVERCLKKRSNTGERERERERERETIGLMKENHTVQRSKGKIECKTTMHTEKKKGEHEGQKEEQGGRVLGAT